MKIFNWKLFNESIVGNIPIQNMEKYNKDMSTSYIDKLFFMDTINPDVVVDFGCANGFILSKIQSKNPNIKIIGYDLDKKMLLQASSKLGENALLTDNWNEVVLELKKYKSPALILSSVIHEVYSYSQPSAVKKFWSTQVFGNSFKWICIRDMIPSIKMERKDKNHFNDDVVKVREKSNPHYLRSFENIWGSISHNYRTLIHYLLKYEYTDNWDREVNENYVPITIETLYKKIPSSWSIMYEENFILPYLKNKIMEDFGIEIDHTTHTKMIIKNNVFKDITPVNESVEISDQEKIKK